MAYKYIIPFIASLLINSINNVHDVSDSSGIENEMIIAKAYKNSHYC